MISATPATVTEDRQRSHMRPASLHLMRSDYAVVATSLAFGIFYATLRYNFFKGTPLADWPTYTVNKALGLSSLILLALTVRRWSVGRPSQAFMLWPGIFAGLHILLSLTLLAPDYYSKFFDGQKLTGIASLSLLFGATATALQELGARKGRGWATATRQKVLCLLIAITGLHAALPGLPGWITPASWPGGLPPITLVSATIALVAIGTAILRNGKRPS